MLKSRLWRLLIAGVARRRSGARPARGATRGAGQSELDPATPRGYSPENVGNDASARPWEAQADMLGTPATERPAWTLPPEFDAAPFLAACKTHFVALQHAWDRADTACLRALLTEAMFEQIQTRLTDRATARTGARGPTDVVLLDAQLLGVENLGGHYLASVEFSGLLREDAAIGPNPFREIWSISRPHSPSAIWLVADVQALD